MVLNGAANRDPRRFEHPDEFVVDRANARQHLAFGHGVHTCPGAPLARAEARVSIERLLDRMADITISEAEHGPRRRPPLPVRADVHPPRPHADLHLSSRRRIAPYWRTALSPGRLPEPHAQRRQGVRSVAPIRGTPDVTPLRPGSRRSALEEPVDVGAQLGRVERLGLGRHREVDGGEHGPLDVQVQHPLRRLDRLPGQRGDLVRGRERGGEHLVVGAHVVGEADLGRARRA